MEEPPPFLSMEAIPTEPCRRQSEYAGHDPAQDTDGRASMLDTIQHRTQDCGAGTRALKTQPATTATKANTACGYAPHDTALPSAGGRPLVTC